MREILFRGKRKDTNEWTEGYFFKSWDRTFLLWGMTNDHPNMVEVIPETVSQFTGLTDKYEKKIFEGDIITQYYEVASYCKDSRSGYHVGGVKISAWNGAHLKDPISHNSETGDNTKVHHSVNVCGSRCEITGNIYDNPDLLTDKRALYLGEINKSATVEKVDSIIDNAVLDADITLKELHSIYAAAYSKIKELK